MGYSGENRAVPKPLDIDDCVEAYIQVTKQRRTGPGRMQVFGWDIEYIDAGVLASFIDQLLIRRLDDFIADQAQPVILDCGANIGFSVLNYKRQYPSASITAFEADPKFIPYLRNNLVRNGAGDVSVVEAAVWVEDGEVTWFPEGMDGSKIVHDRRVADDLVRVPAVDLAKYLKQSVDLLKLDIEGAEYRILDHIKADLSNVKNVLVECHLDQTNILGLSSLLEVLVNAGFKVGINTYGPWRDLTRQPGVLPHHWEQYLLVAGWREPVRVKHTDASILPYVGVPILLDQQPAEKASIELIRTGLLGNENKIVKYALPRPFVKDRGLCWSVRLPEFVSLGDDNDNSARSNVLVFEDQKPLGPAHVLHDDVRNKGRGRYSHWCNVLYFSTSDGSDPNVNGRSYELVFVSRQRDWKNNVGISELTS